MKVNKRIYNKLSKRITRKTARKAKKDTRLFRRSGLMAQYNASRAPQADLELRNTEGAIELEKGFLIQWGRVYHDADGTSDNQPQTYYFKQKFRVACFGVICNMQKSGTASANASEITRSGFQIDSSTDLNSERYINYIAIGF